jgi:hypothetical protein
MRSSSSSRRYLDEIDIYCVFKFKTETPPGFRTGQESRRDLHPRPATPAPICVGRMADRQESRRDPPANSARQRRVDSNQNPIPIIFLPQPIV